MFEFARFLFAILLIGFFGAFLLKKNGIFCLFSSILPFADCCYARKMTLFRRNYAVARFGGSLSVICFFVRACVYGK